MPKPDLCPICGAPTQSAHTPFCSRGCKDRDLLRWLGEGYRIPAGPVTPEDESAAPGGLDSADTPD